MNIGLPAIFSGLAGRHRSGTLRNTLAKTILGGLLAHLIGPAYRLILRCRPKSSRAA